MKLTNKIFAFAIAAMSLVACNNDDDNNDYQSEVVEDYARFLNPGDVSISEASTDVITLPVYINYRTATDLTINYTLSGDAGSYEDLSDTPGSIVIPANQRAGEIQIMAVDNEDYNEIANSVTIELSGADNGYSITDKEEYRVVTITFEDNDCPPSPRDNFVGDLDALDVGYNSVPAVGSLPDNCTSLIINGDLANAGASGDLPFVFDFNFDNGTVVCEQQPYGAYAYTYQASGTFNDTEIEVYYEFRKADGSLFWDGTNIITRL